MTQTGLDSSVSVGGTRDNVSNRRIRQRPRQLEFVICDKTGGEGDLSGAVQRLDWPLREVPTCGCGRYDGFVLAGVRLVQLLFVLVKVLLIVLVTVV